MKSVFVISPYHYCHCVATLVEGLQKNNIKVFSNTNHNYVKNQVFNVETAIKVAEKTDVVVQIDNIADLSGGSVQALVGFETIQNRYMAEYDRKGEAGLTGGSAGNSGGGIRDIDSIFGEILLPVMDNLEVTASFRRDDYSDVGEADSF